MHGKLMTGTAEPFGYQDPTVLNFILMRLLEYSYFRSPFYVKIWRIITHYPRTTYYDLRWKFLDKVYWPLRCKLGFHQKGMYLMDIRRVMTPHCFWCGRDVGKKFMPKTLDKYAHVIGSSWRDK